MRLGAYSPENVQRLADAALRRMVDEARAEGGLGPDVTVEDLGLLIVTMPGGEAPESVRRRWAELAFLVDRWMVERNAGAAESVMPNL